MNISLGTPNSDIVPIANTGSDLIWTQCKPFSKCFKQHAPIFNLHKSSTYKKISCCARQCKNLQGSSCSIHNSCQYSVFYGDSSFSGGSIAADKLTLASTTSRPIVVPNIVIGCGHNNSGSFGEKTSSIIGLGQGEHSQENSRIACYLIPKLGSHELRIIIDSGTTLTLLPTELYLQLESAMSNQINATKIEVLKGYNLLCYDARNDIEIPDVTVHFTDVNVKLKPLNTFVKLSDTVRCFSFYSVEDFAIYGNLEQLFEVKGQFVPALFIFGDSIFDVGNNNDLVTLIKANFPPYGRDFVDHEPTGRFCNGKLALDIIAEGLRFTDHQPAYMNDKANGEMLLIGANFASAASGYYNATAILYNTISLSQQLENYREYKNKLVDITGKSNASSRISRGIHLISDGSSDFLQNYYINPLLFTTYTPDTFSDILLNSYDHFIQNLYELGARRIGVATLPPLGCLPAAITAFGHGNNQCVARLNNNAISFNNKLKHRSQRLTRRLSKLKLVVLDIYNPLYTLITEPAENGFAEVRRACCGTGLLETSILCNQHSIGTCSNASQYVFWDSFHPTEAANQILAQKLITSGM
ncbi:GDSL esterase/lipase At5g22810-like [Gossypium arboreum]|uniref:GDSL esterase/lipase At5g22810-like n=1 Tax=Gossypium arboreum TaxID=29729 RepID=UPI0022F1D524|nr:GDSL esterase/lipase At5g22810-like [Gossypium arboreum]